MKFEEEILKINERLDLLEAAHRDGQTDYASPDHLRVQPEVKPDLGPTTPMPEAERQKLFAESSLANIGTQTGVERTDTAQQNAKPEDQKKEQPPSDQKSDEQQKADQDRFQQAQTATESPSYTDARGDFSQAGDPYGIGANYTNEAFQTTTVQDSPEASIVVAEHKEEGENGHGE